MRQFKMKEAPPHFGCHPDIKKYYRRMDSGHIDSWIDDENRRTVPLTQFFDQRHPSVYVIPRGPLYRVIDRLGDVIGIDEFQIPFSSTNLFFNRDDKWVFEELSNGPFWRLGGISQLGYLVPPYPERFPKLTISFASPLFPHPRWLHCLIAAGMAEVILARNDFSKKERAPIVLTVGHHDIAIPAGGDSIKRIDPAELNEEINFAHVLNLHGLVERWTEIFGFDIEQASDWVKNQGLMGFLLDVIDRMSYVCLDCYHLGHYIDGPLRQHCLRHPLFMNVWRDIKFTRDKNTFAFTNPQRLFHFLLARAYEHQQLLLNPYARILDFFLTNLVKPLYHNGTITKEQLLAWSTDDLQRELTQHYPKEKVQPAIITPDKYKWKRFDTEWEMREYCELLGDTVYHTEQLTGFNTCLDWPVFKDKKRTKIVPLQSLLTPEQITLMEKVNNSTKGYFVYWYIQDPK